MHLLLAPVRSAPGTRPRGSRASRGCRSRGCWSRSRWCRTCRRAALPRAETCAQGLDAPHHRDASSTTPAPGCEHPERIDASEQPTIRLMNPKRSATRPRAPAGRRSAHAPARLSSAIVRTRRPPSSAAHVSDHHREVGEVGVVTRPFTSLRSARPSRSSAAPATARPHHRDRTPPAGAATRAAARTRSERHHLAARQRRRERADRDVGEAHQQHRKQPRERLAGLRVAVQEEQRGKAPRSPS